MKGSKHQQNDAQCNPLDKPATLFIQAHTSMSNEGIEHQANLKRLGRFSKKCRDNEHSHHKENGTEHQQIGNPSSGPGKESRLYEHDSHIKDNGNNYGYQY